MKTEDYTKHKDCSPEETVFRIRRILQEADLYPVLTWTEDEFDGVCSNRVFLDPVMGLGTNGKGTGRRYAEASAFAELIERIQNRILHIKAFGPEESPYPISDRYPDEKDMRLEELVAQKDAFLEGLFRCLGFQTAMEKKLYLQKAAEEFYDKTDGPIAGLHCEYPAAAEILKKLDRAMARSSVSQEALLEKLKGLAAQS